jgi:hypothetical protein
LAPRSSKAPQGKGGETLNGKNFDMPKVMFFLVLLLFAAGGSALAGRAVTDDERAKLGAAVSAAGCSGGKFEFDDGQFEADNATCEDGKKYDLKFDASFNLVKKELED